MYRLIVAAICLAFAGSAAAQNGTREYANSRIDECNSAREQARARSTNPFSAFPLARSENERKQRLASCIARHYIEDDRFISGYFLLLSELPAERARDLHSDVTDHVEALTLETDPLGPWKLAMNGCKLIRDADEFGACTDAVVGSVPERLR